MKNQKSIICLLLSVLLVVSFSFYPAFAYDDAIIEEDASNENSITSIESADEIEADASEDIDETELDNIDYLDDIDSGTDNINDTVITDETDKEENNDVDSSTPDSQKEDDEVMNTTDNVNVSAIEDQVYTGRRIEPKVTVSIGDVVLSEGTDYTISYENNINVGTATATIELSDYFTGSRLISLSFEIVEDEDFSFDKIGYRLSVTAGNTITDRYKEGEKVTVHDMNDVAYKSFSSWNVSSGTLELPSSMLTKKSIQFSMPASDVTLYASYTGKSLKSDLSDEDKRHNNIVLKASSLQAKIDLYTETANKIKSKYGVSSLQSETYYNNQATSTKSTITKKQNQLSALRAAGGHQVEIKQLEQEIKELQADYQMYLELKSAAQYKTKADNAQKELNKLNLTAEASKHEANIADICAKHGVKNSDIAEIEYIRLDQDEYEYTGSDIRPKVTVIDSNGKTLGTESYSLVYPSDCKSIGEHTITLKLKGNYVGTKTKTFTIVKHEYGDWEIIKKATCDKEGLKKKTCVDCGRRIIKTIPISHTGKWTVTKKATELAAGQESRVCTVCGEVEKRTIAKKKPTLPAVQISKVVAGKKYATVYWSKISAKNLKKIASIQIQYSTNKTFKTGVKTTTAKKSAVSKKISKLKSGKRYYFRIRTYKKSGGEPHVSKWSTIKSIKVK